MEVVHECGGLCDPIPRHIFTPLKKINTMKNTIITIVLSTLLVSCGLSTEEQAALDALNSQLSTMTYETEKLDREAKNWWKAFEEEKDLDTRIAFGEEWERVNLKMEILQADITEVKYKISQIQ